METALVSAIMSGATALAVVVATSALSRRRERESV
jgi:hypothetical protein